MRWILLVMMGCLLAGCAGPGSGPRTFTVPASRYARAFDAARDELRRAGYTLERIDAAHGEILTAPKTFAGLTQPLGVETRSVGQMVGDTINNQPRTVRVSFRDAATGSLPADADGSGEIRADVLAVEWRLRRPGWRLETESIRASRNWRDPALAERGIRPGMLTPERRDDTLAARLAARIQRRLDAE